ncbi:MAG: branched-chain amino acid ABC transporter permease [Firmicutes bacterium]|jgi:branched-chain amino acid transport system permease protein|nr:branched-chain amino acid ABC transporter permease [Bacillota bacterium]
MSFILYAIMIGILDGGIYALMACGLTLVFGVMEVINVAQGSLVILGAYMSYVLASTLHLNLYLGLLITMPATFLLGMAIEWAFLRRLRVDRIALSILVTYGVSLAIEGGLGMIFGDTYVALPAPSGTFTLFGYATPDIKLYVFLMACAFLAGLYVLLYRTTFGAALRATVQNRTAAQLIGINVERISTLTFALGAALAAAGGMAFGATRSFHPGSAEDLISRLLVIIVLGGFGSLGGALVGALLFLVVEDMVSVLISPIWGPVVFFAGLILILLVRPQGLFGQLEARRQ